MKGIIGEDIQQISYDIILLSTILDIKEAKKEGDWDRAFRLIDELENLLAPYGIEEFLRKEMNGKEFKDAKELYTFKERVLLKKAKMCGFLPPGKYAGSNRSNI